MWRLDLWCWLVLSILLVCGVGCGDGGDGGDGGDADAQVDGGGTDGGGTDGGGTDGGGTDGGGTDGGGTDGGGTSNTLPPEHAVAAGAQFSMAIDGAGALWTWGGALGGTLGNGVLSGTGPLHGNAYAPTRPVNLDGLPVTHVAAGSYHAVALQQNGDVWTWGDNGSGELGNDDLPNGSLVPVRVATGPTVDVAAGAGFTLRIDGAGALWAWGYNGDGQLGNGSGIPSPIAVAVDVSALPAGITFAAVGAGRRHAVALANDGTVWTFGTGGEPLGLGGPSPAQTPAQVVGEGGVGFLGPIVAIASGDDHVLALAEDGVVWAWGGGFSGQLGTGDGTPSNTPVRVDTSTFTAAVTGLRAGGDQSFALLSDASVWGWGENDSEQLGVGVGDLLSPLRIDIPGGVRDVAGGDRHGIAIDAAGGFHGWGVNIGGGLGSGLGSGTAVPVPTYGPAGLSPVAIAPAKEAYSFIEMSDGSMWGVGRGWNQSGGISGGASPTVVEPLIGFDIAQIAAGQSHTLFLDSAGAVWGFGANSSGQLGDGTNTVSPTPVAVDFSALPVGVTISKVGLSGSFSAALATDGTVWTWGRGRWGQLGDGTTNTVSTPIQVHDSVDLGFLGGIVDLAVGGDHVVALDGNGIAWTWGAGSSGQLGATRLTTCPGACNRLPQQVCDIGTDVNACTVGGDWLGAVHGIAAGGSHTLLRRNDQVLGFGDKNHGQVGDGTWSSFTRVLVPINVRNETDTGPLTNIASIAAVSGSSYAVAVDGTVYGWGDNGRGQLGRDPTTTVCGGNRYCLTQPTVIPGLAGLTLVSFAAGSDHAFVLDDTGVVWSWGYNDNGQLGRISTGGAPGGGRVGFVPAPILLLPR